jgi:PAS domain S-box-containing protein
MAQRDCPESELDLALLIKESPDALIALAPNGSVLFWSTGAETIFGFSCEEARGRSLEELVVPPAQREEARQAMRDVLEQGSTLFESVRQRKDGTLVDVDVSMRLVKNQDGSVRFIAANKKDITQLQRLREERDVEGMFRGLLEAAPSGPPHQVFRRAESAVHGLRARPVRATQRQQRVSRRDQPEPARNRGRGLGF